MTHPEQPPGPAPAPPAEIVEWGAGPAREGFPWGGWPGRQLPVARVLAGLGAVALFAATIGDWQLVSRRFSRPSEFGEVLAEESQQVGMGLETVGGFGLVWLAGAVGLAICVWLTLFGLPAIRAYARSVGVATAGVLLGLLAAAAVSASTDLTEPLDLSLEMAEQHQPGWGLYAAFGSVLLLGAASWLARVPATPTPAGDPGAPSSAPATTEPAVPDQGVPGQGVPGWAGPADLAVRPAEPFAQPDDDRHR